MPAIAARALTKTYPGDVTALRDLSFSVEEGTVFGLLGPNGAGKSTAVKILTTLSAPDTGEATVAGFDVLAEPGAVRNRPQVLFLDEPTTGLDPEVRAEMWKEIARLTAEDGLTVLLTTHHMEEADGLAARVAIVDRGRVVAEGTPDALKRELRGDAIHVELAEGAHDGRVREALDRLDGVREAAWNGSAVHARADDGARAVPRVLAALESDGVEVVSATVARPSLDDVYLRYAGRTIGAAEAESDRTTKEEIR